MNAQELKELLDGAQLDLLDRNTVEQFWFSHGDTVVATLGTRDGAVCAPVLRFHATPDAKVEITDGRAISITWEQLELSEGVLTAKFGSHLRRFKFTPGKKRSKPYLP